MGEFFDDLGKLIQSVQASGASNLILWGATLVGAAVAFGWVILGGDAVTVKARAEAIAQLWPVVAPWITGLTAKSAVTGSQKREALRTTSFLQAKRIEADATMRSASIKAGAATGSGVVD